MYVVTMQLKFLNNVETNSIAFIYLASPKFYIFKSILNIFLALSSHGPPLQLQIIKGQIAFLIMKE